MIRIFIAAVLILFTYNLSGQTSVNSNRVQVPVNSARSWWVGIIDHGYQMPLEDGYAANVNTNNYGNQVQPLLLSNEGDVIWSEHPFSLECRRGEMLVESKDNRIPRSKPGTTLREAFAFASKTYFPPSGKAPDEL